MLVVRSLMVCAAVCVMAAPALGQRVIPRPPIADPVDEPLLPGGISRQPVFLNSQLAYLFTDDAGISVSHFVGDFILTVGDGGGPELQSNEAVVWTTTRNYRDLSYQHLQVLLWGDAQILELSGTITRGPVLFVTLNTTGPIESRVDGVAIQPAMDTRLYEYGAEIRSAMERVEVPGVDEGAAVQVFDVSRIEDPRALPEPPPVVHVESEGQWQVQMLADGQWVLTVTGGVYLSRGEPGNDTYFELRADSVVVFLGLAETAPILPPPQPDGEEPLGGLPRGVERPDGDVSTQPAARRDRDPERQFLSTGFGEVEVEAAYLEGDVVLAQGLHSVRASRLYFDFLHDRALILDAVVHTTIVARDIPLYLRAAEIRQLSRSRFVAEQAMLTTSEFHTPHYHIGADRVELDNLTPAGTAGRLEGVEQGAFRIHHATLNVGMYPIAYWPYVQGNLDTSETALKSVRTGFSDQFGGELESDWEMFHLLGLETPEGVDATLSLDYFTRRGPAVGVDAQYLRDRYFGEIRSYLLSDDDRDRLGRERERPRERDVRGRFLARHRQYLEDDWQLTLEVSYISDRTFLEQFFESEFFEEKEQETLLYLKRQRENWALTALLQYRILNFTTETERLPDFGYFRVGESLADHLPALKTPVSWYSENRFGVVRRRAGDQTLRDFLREGRLSRSGSVFRGDSRHELTSPVDVGPMRFVPFVSIRGTAWDDSPDDGGVARVFGTYGFHGTMFLSRIYPDVRSVVWGIDGLRHIIKLDATAWMAHTNRDSDELFPFDSSVERVDEVDGVSVGMRQRWQTRRGPPGADGRRHTVDVFTHDLEVGVFNDAPGDTKTNGFLSFSRPEASIARNFVNSALIWQINDATSLHHELNFDLNDGEVDIFNVALAVERTPRFNYLLAYRLIEDSRSNLLGFDMNYQLNEKHTVAIRELFDLREGRTLDFTVALVRRFPRWLAALSFSLDEAEDDFGVSFSIWPEGLPQAALGSRRFAGINRISRLGRY